MTSREHLRLIRETSRTRFLALRGTEFAATDHFGVLDFVTTGWWIIRVGPRRLTRMHQCHKDLSLLHVLVRVFLAARGKKVD